MFTETSNKIDEMRALLAKIGKLLDLPTLRKEVASREAEAGEPSFWADSVKAKKKSKELNDLKKTVAEYDKAQITLDDLKAHCDLATEMQDEGVDGHRTFRVVSRVQASADPTAARGPSRSVLPAPSATRQRRRSSRHCPD